MAEAQPILARRGRAAHPTARLARPGPRLRRRHQRAQRQAAVCRHGHVRHGGRVGRRKVAEAIEQPDLDRRRLPDHRLRRPRPARPAPPRHELRRPHPQPKVLAGRDGVHALPVVQTELDEVLAADREPRHGLVLRAPRRAHHRLDRFDVEVKPRRDVAALPQVTRRDAARQVEVHFELVVANRRPVLAQVAVAIPRHELQISLPTGRDAARRAGHA